MTSRSAVITRSPAHTMALRINTRIPSRAQLPRGDVPLLLLLTDKVLRDEQFVLAAQQRRQSVGDDGALK